MYVYYTSSWKPPTVAALFVSSLMPALIFIACLCIYNDIAEKASAYKSPMLCRLAFQLFLSTCPDHRLTCFMQCRSAGLWIITLVCACVCFAGTQGCQLKISMEIIVTTMI